MKAVLEFNLPEESSEHLASSNAINLSAAYDEIDNHLRNEIKYNYQAWEGKTALDAFDHMRDFLRSNAEEFRIKDIVLK